MVTLERNLTYECMLNLSVSGPSSYEVTKELRSFNQTFFFVSATKIDENTNTILDRNFS